MAATDVFPPDYSTPVGQVRSLIPDVELLEDPADLSAEAEYIFNDDVIQSYLALARDNIFRAAAFAVNTLATTEGLILKVLRSDDRQTDGGGFVIPRGVCYSGRASSADAAAGFQPRLSGFDPYRACQWPVTQ